MDNKQNNKKTPVIDTILVIILIFLLLSISVMVLVYLCRMFIAMFEYISKIDAVIIVALITGSISLIVTIISRVIDYKNSRKQYLAQKREIPYEEFIAMVYKVQRNINNHNSYTDDEMVNDVKEFSEALTLWGSKKVAEKWVKFRLNSNNNSTPEEILYILEDILNEMRADMGVKKLKTGTLLSFFVNDLNQKE